MDRARHAVTRVSFTAIVICMATAISAQEPTSEQRSQLQGQLLEFDSKFAALKKASTSDRREQQQALADIEICGKAVDWCLLHSEFYRPNYVEAAHRAIEIGHRRMAAFEADGIAVPDKPGSSVRGYLSTVDQSIQPYAVTLPADFKPDRSRRWPLHLKLHGRNGRLGS